MQKNIRLLVMAALLATMVFIATFLLRIPVPLTSGAYINLGDSVVCIGALLPGGIYAILAAGLGSALADIMAGSLVYALPTFLIKAGMCFLCWAVIRKKNSFRCFLLGSILSGAWMIFGYFITELILFGWAYVLVTLPGNLIQWGSNVAIGCLFYLAAQKLPSALWKQKIEERENR